jgi:signal transduction histidine kinase/CheY-like chemotaxis protein
VIVYVNEIMREVLTVTETGIVVGRPIDTVVSSPYVAPLREGESSEPLDVEFIAGDGPLRLEVVRTHADFDGRRSEVWLARDVSARHRDTASLVKADRMIAMGTLAAGIGHEINNPLSFVMLNLEQLSSALAGRASDADTARLSALVDTSIDGTRRIHGVVRALSFFSRQPAKRQPVEVELVVEAAIAITQNEIRHRATLVTDVEPGLWVDSTETGLGQVLVNLLVNAAHAIPEGAPASHTVDVKVHTVDDRVMVRVADTGVGIPEADLDRIFEPFYTTKPRGQGTGLGLGICQEIVRNLGGEMGVTSAPGKGSEFWFALPRLPRVAVQAELRVTGDHAVSRPTVLLVDDEPQLLRALRRVLQSGADVEVASSAGEALDVLDRMEPPDVVLSDLMMPDGSGMDLHRALEERDPELAARVVFMSGGIFTPDAQAFRERVDNLFLDKPVSVDALFDAIRTVRRQRKRREAAQEAS